jgi:hypothetical protein
MIRSQSLSSAAMILLALYGCRGDVVSIPTQPPTPPAPPPPPAATYSIGGRISFSTAGTAVLQNSGGDDLTVSNAGTFTFPTKLPTGAAYSVSVKSSPSMPLQDCQAPSGAQNPSMGTVAGADVTSVVVQCAPVMSKLGGTVTGLVGSGLVLAYDSNVEMLPIAAAGSFVFATPALSTSNYVVTVATQPTAPVQTCSVTNGIGQYPTADVTNVQVTCSGPALARGTENRTVVKHAGNIAASETWAGAGTVHLIPNTIGITAPPTVTI